MSNVINAEFAALGLKFKAENATEQRILDYLTENASDVLVAKINSGTKTLAGSLNYAKEEARKMADGGQSIMVEDETVFGWIIHFFEDDEIKEKAKPKAKVAGNAKPPAKPKPAKPIMADLFLDDNGDPF